MPLNEIHTYLERLATLMRAETRRCGSKHGLLPVHIDALHYLSRCNRYSDTPQGVAEYLGITKGTASQTLNILEARGLIAKHRDTKDKRIVHLLVSPNGQRLLRDFVPAPLLGATANSFSAIEKHRIAEMLRELLHSCQSANGYLNFGQCNTCRFHLKRGKNQFQCGLTKETLSSKEGLQICREYAA